MNSAQTQEDKDFVKWAIDYLDDNPYVDMEDFKNQFLGKSEGSYEDYDALYWDNPNLSFPQQALPTWVDYFNAFPKTFSGSGLTGPEVYNLVGGTPLLLRNSVLNDNDPTNDRDYDNACALRASRALNYSGMDFKLYKKY